MGYEVIGLGRGEYSASDEWVGIYIGQHAEHPPPDPLHSIGDLSALSLIRGFVPAIPIQTTTAPGDPAELEGHLLDQYRAAEAERPQRLWIVALATSTRRVRIDSLLTRWFAPTNPADHALTEREVRSSADEAGLGEYAVLASSVLSDTDAVRRYPLCCGCADCIDARERGPIAALADGAPAVVIWTGAEPAD